MTNKELQQALLSKTKVNYDDNTNKFDDVIVTAIVLRNVKEKLAITSVELGDKNGNTFYNVSPKYINSASWTELW